ncbi:class I SAM-dependent methyltransferase [Alteribacillus sp. HJP-4]
MLQEWKKLLQARKWMKKNESFLPTWHAHLGYSLDLFDHFKKPEHPEKIADVYQLDKTLLNRWVEVGLAVGHLNNKGNGKIKSDKTCIQYISKHSPDSVGALLKEMLELHIPTMLAYKDLMAGREKINYMEADFGKTVAETSELLETLAFPKVMNCIKKHKVKSVIDMGCGYGGYLHRIHEKKPGLSLTGIEIHEEIVEEAKKRMADTTINIKHEDLTNLETGKAKTDLIMLNNILYYFPTDDRQQLFEKATDIVSNKGRMLVMTPIHDAAHGKAFSAAFNSFMSAHDNLFPLPSEKEIKQYAKKTGWKVKDVDPIVKEGGWYLFHLKKV